MQDVSPSAALAVMLIAGLLPVAGCGRKANSVELDSFGEKIVKLGGRPELHLDMSNSKITDEDLAKLEKSRRL